MKCVVVFLIAAHAIICSGTVHPAYNPVFEYDVPVASQPIVYASPSVHPGPYVGSYGSYGSYAVHTTPAVSHSYSQTQTHPVSYVKPVTVFGGSSSYYAPAYGSAYGQSVSGNYYQPAAATSRVESTRLIVPQTSRIFRYQSNQQYNNAPQSGESQYNNQDSNRNVKNQRRPQNNNQGFNRNSEQYSQNGPAQYQDQYNRNGQNQFDQNEPNQYNRRVYAGSMPYTNDGEQVKLRRYRIHRPGLKKEFYDVEERTIIRPAGSAVVEFDPPSKKQDITDYQPYGPNSNFNQGQWNSQKGSQGQGTKGRNNGFRPNQGGFNQGGQSGQGGFNQGNQGGQGGQSGFNQGGQSGFNQGGQSGFNQGGQSGFNQGGQSGFNQGGQSGQGGGSNDGQLFITDEQDVGFQVPDCGYGQQTPVYEYGPPVTSFGNQQPPQYHPTTFSPPSNNYPTTTSSFPTTTAGYPTTSTYPTTANIPNQTYLPPNYGSTDQSIQSTSTGGDFNSSPTPGSFIPSSTAGSSSTGSPTTTPQQSEIYISSTTPVTVTIVDKNENNTQSRKTPFQKPGIIYAGQGGQGNQGNQGAAQGGQRSQGGQGFYYSQPSQNGQADDNQPDQFQNELPPRGDLSQYRSAEQPDQFYHELPRSRYTNQPNQPNRPPQAYNVFSRSRGEPTEAPYGRIEDAETVDIGRMRNGTNAQNRTGNGNNQQTARLIQLYTGNGGVTEVGQTEDQDDSRYSPDQNRNQNAQYQDAGNVRGRIISVTPPPATALPTETVNRRRIVVSKPVTTVEEIVEPDNSTNANEQKGNNNQRGNYRSNYADGNRRDQSNRNYNNNNGERDENNRNYNNNNYNNNGDNRADNRYQNSFESNEFNDNGESAKYRNDNNFSGYDDNSSEFNGNSRRAEYNDNADNYRSGEFYSDSRENFDDGNYNGNANSQSQSRKANVEDDSKASTPTGVFISTTPSTASQRIIYVQPVSQDFASQKAVPPKNQ